MIYLYKEKTKWKWYYAGYNCESEKIEHYSLNLKKEHFDQGDLTKGLTAKHAKKIQQKIFANLGYKAAADQAMGQRSASNTPVSEEKMLPPSEFDQNIKKAIENINGLEQSIDAGKLDDIIEKSRLIERSLRLYRNAFSDSEKKLQLIEQKLEKRQSKKETTSLSDFSGGFHTPPKTPQNKNEGKDKEESKLMEID